MSDDKVEIKMDDVLVAVQALTTAIQKRSFSNDEFKQIRPSWERLSDVMSKLQRSRVVAKLYPDDKSALAKNNDSVTVKDDETKVEGEDA